jgi:hypothetical protein
MASKMPKNYDACPNEFIVQTNLLSVVLGGPRPNFEDEHSSGQFSAGVKICKIDPWLPDTKS